MPTVLVLDDEPIIHMLVETILTADPLRDRTGQPLQLSFADAESSLRAWLDTQPPASVALLLTDCQLGPATFGPTLWQRHRSHPAFGAAAVCIAWSTDAAPAMSQAARQAGVQAFLRKDHTDRLRADLQAILDQCWAADAAGRPRPWTDRG